MKDVIEGLALLVLSLIAIWGAWQVPQAAPGETWAGLVPFGAALALFGLSLFLVTGGLRSVSHGSGFDDQQTSTTGTREILTLFLIALVYQQSFRWFGYVLPTAIVAPVVLYMFGVRNKVGLTASVFLCPLVFHIIFFELLGVFPPYGEVFDLLDAIRG
ncbi:tripartite tricarboxylate transporter TctB family protein [Roseibium sp. SCP14]|uniref:tripartite tricarboxylate transporter TctB family protein n=1 Tax=Roseibium sp. SCP14 TaxID=3141375 RepID=UPI00333C6D7C